MNEIERDIDSFTFKLAGLLNYVGGSFNTEDLEKMKFRDVLNHCVRNGIEIQVIPSSNKISKLKPIVEKEELI